MKSPVALTALERTIVGVDIDVNLICTALAERPAANVAMVLPDVGVCQQVFLVDVAYLERLATFCAQKRSIVTVSGAQMHVEVVLVVKCHRALLAFEWFFAGVGSHMNFALARAGETSVASLVQTGKWSFTGMDSHVHSQILKQ